MVIQFIDIANGVPILDGGVNVGVYEVQGLLQKLPCENDGGCGTVPYFCILGLRDLDQHLGCRVLYIHLLEDRHTVVGYDNIPHGVHEHLVHSPGTKAAPHRVRNRPGCCDVVELSVLPFVSFRSFFKNHYRCVTHAHIFIPPILLDCLTCLKFVLLYKCNLI
ncbi:hypothetical protein SDC9_113510 [bioreactor metagenome]|uniref:Uncharacterized protein n=1 Tax=bioreactor metagenome TaxID=1076179 RepID=A0A645BM95_9ZZZZ